MRGSDRQIAKMWETSRLAAARHTRHTIPDTILAVWQTAKREAESPNSARSGTALPSASQKTSPLAALLPDLPVRPTQAAGGAETPRRYLWRGNEGKLVRGSGTALPLELLLGVEEQKQRLIENTHRFATGLSAHHALLWGARGTGKSSLVKSVHALFADSLSLIGILPNDLSVLGTLFDELESLAPNRFILFLDDIALDDGDDYHTLKVTLDGGVSEVPANCLIYTTSNRRHITDRRATETESARALRPDEVVEDKVSLADRFGLSLGFYPLTRDIYLEAVLGYWKTAGLPEDKAFKAEAEKFSRLRGGLSGRVALQFVRDYAARQGKAFPF